MKLTAQSGTHAPKPHQSHPQWTFLEQCDAYFCLSFPLGTHRLSLLVLAEGGPFKNAPRPRIHLQMPALPVPCPFQAAGPLPPRGRLGMKEIKCN